MYYYIHHLIYWKPQHPKHPEPILSIFKSPQRSVIVSIHNDPIPSENHLHRPITTKDPYNNISLSLRDVGMYETAIYLVISSIINKSLWLSVIDVVNEITLQTSAWHVVHHFIRLPCVIELLNKMPNMDQLQKWHRLV